MNNNNNYSQFDNLNFKTENNGFFSNITNKSNEYWNDINNNFTGDDGFFNKIKSNIPYASNTNKPVEQKSFYQEVQESTSLSFYQRLIGFAIFFIIGIVFLGMSTFFILAPKTFAKFYTIGSLCLFGSSMVLVGVKKHFQTMFSGDRLFPSLIYIGSIFCTLYFALVLKSTPLSLISVILQLGALVWYSLSYIPMGRQVVGGFVSTVYSFIRS
ncbi:hypothetical protein CYY_000645 [Polysphondylium violaceum]|uniref:Vesicle transport protein n=1 Tax=Polysphondylium violaceum TaxID=133409 RepID=A0A8J4Q3C9_9MYCE|nr:hypothetical protein CYY_000645 [Polysphondylium violaceum]